MSASGLDVWVMPISGSRDPSGVEVPAGDEIKILLKVPEADEVSVYALGPDGYRVEPTSVKGILGSNWDRPGRELGSFWRFKSAGAWELVVQSESDRQAQLAFTVTSG